VKPVIAPVVKPGIAPIIAIDGPAAAGKGTLARRIAAALKLPYLDTGLLYRAVGRRVLDAAGDPQDPTAATAIPGVRTALLDFQRSFGATSGAVLDGRDIGTVIFPDAPVKLYVTATPAERARRRWVELQAAGVPASLPEVEADLRARDTRDAPNMRQADDAIPLDTTALDADAAFASALEVIRTRLGRW
jgi:cytidylate kinase